MAFLPSTKETAMTTLASATPAPTVSSLDQLWAQRRTLAVLAATQTLGGAGLSTVAAVGGLAAAQLSGSAAIGGLALTAGTLGAALVGLPSHDPPSGPGAGRACGAVT
jgi:hypothetical protein